MNGNVFALSNLFLFADLRPEPAIITPSYANFAGAVIDLAYNLGIIDHLGNDFRYFY
jgi:hypothetical protein